MIREKGEKVTVHKASDLEYGKKLKEKLQEEVNEFLESNKKEEIADILEVVDAVCEYNKIDKKEVKVLQAKKARERGKFKKRWILEN